MRATIGAPSFSINTNMNIQLTHRVSFMVLGFLFLCYGFVVFGVFGKNDLKELKLKSASSSPEPAPIKETVLLNNDRNITMPIESSTLPCTKITFFINLQTPGGLGNKVLALSQLLALARASHRCVSVYGTGVIWKEYWSSSFGNDFVPPLKNDNSNNKVLHCTIHDLNNPNGTAHKAVFHNPETILVVQVNGNYGDCTSALSKFSEFPLAYRTAMRDLYAKDNQEENIEDNWVHEDDNTIPSEVLLTVEVPTVFHTPTQKLNVGIHKFMENHNLAAVNMNNKVNNNWLFDLALHIRKCVDCGWEMTKDHIQSTITCALEEYQLMVGKPIDIGDGDVGNNNNSSWNGTTIFLTSDTRSVVDIVKEVLPLGVRLVENIPTTFVHTDKNGRNIGNDMAVLPYIDNNMLGESKVVASCFTSYGMIGVSRSTNENNCGPKRLHSVIVLEHHLQQTSLRKCKPLVMT